MTHPLTKLRTKLNMTQHQLADACGVGQANISTYENGTRLPIVTTAFKFIHYAKTKHITILLHEFYEDLR